MKDAIYVDKVDAGLWALRIFNLPLTLDYWAYVTGCTNASHVFMRCCP